MMREGMRELSQTRMAEITSFYAAMPGVLAVAAFGSNADWHRFDDNSDLDFLVFVTVEAKSNVLEQTSKLETLGAVAGYQILYGDAVQLLFADGVLCDFGVVTPEQLSTFPHGAGHYLWHSKNWEPVDLAAAEPARSKQEALLHDTLFKLCIGLFRANRGEEAAAFDEIQVGAAQRMLAILQGDEADVFTPFRQAEQKPAAECLSAFMPGYGHSREAAKAMLEKLSFAKELPLYQAVLGLTR